jgi:hypothetical protein
VSCPPNTFALGGGGSVTTDQAIEQGHIQLTQTSPNTTGGTPNGWIVTVSLNANNAGGKTVIAYVVCSG